MINFTHMRFPGFLFIIFLTSLLNGQNTSVDSLLNLMGEAKKKDPDKAMEYALKAFQIVKDKHLNERVVEMNYNVGMLYIQKGDYKNALDYFERNLQKGINTSNTKFISRASINMANIYLAQGKYNSALDRYLQALKFVEKGNDKELLYVNYLCLGITYYYLKNYSKSLEFYQKCVDLEKQKSKSDKLAYSYNAMGLIYKETGDYNKAMEYLELTNEIALHSGDSAIMSHNLGNLGELYGIKGDPIKAKQFLNNALNMQLRLKDEKGAGETFILSGNLELEQGYALAAIDQYGKALSIGKRIGINDIIKDAYKGLADAYTQLKDFKLALEYQKAYSIVKDSLFNTTSSMQIADMQTRYDTEKKENENVLLQKENAIKTLEIDKQKSQRNLLIIVFTVLSMIGLLIYNSTRLRNRNKILAEKELRNMAVFQAQEKEKMHLSKELHDGLGPLLSLIKLNISSVKTEPGSEKMLTEVKDLASQSIMEVRNISHALAPSLLQKQGLQAALNDFVSQVNTSGNIHAELKYAISDKLNESAEINIYRIVQEAINNTIKHSGADRTVIALDKIGSDIKLAIKDNGNGFMPDKNKNGNGLNNIYSRVDFLKGSIVINSKEGKGTEFNISIPLSYNTNA